MREAKERFCKVSSIALPSALGKMTAINVAKEEVLRLPDGNIVVVGNEAYSSPELLFNPGMMKNGPQFGLADLVYQSAMRCDVALRRRLLSNIMLTGGNSLLPGLDLRLQNEVLSKMEGEMKNLPVWVVAQEGREHFAWDGGAHLCSLSSFQTLWVMKQHYMETGAAINIEKVKVYVEDVPTLEHSVNS